jgi:hypothetical protein
MIQEKLEDTAAEFLLSFKQCSSQNALNGGVITVLTAIDCCPICSEAL